MPKRHTLIALCALVCALPLAPALAAPSGEHVIHGGATFTHDGNTTTIDTTTQQTIVQYDSFDIYLGEIVQINQPTDDSRILNHIPHGDPTVVNGQLLSNGFVYILNPSGVFLGSTAIIDVGGLVAAAGSLDYDAFLAGQDRFTGLTGDVEVAGGALVHARDQVALIGRRVANYGTVVSEGGMIALVAGDAAVLGSLDGHLIVRIDGSGEHLGDDAGFALTQGGTVDAGDGGVRLSAGDTYSLAMNHTGVTRGRDVQLEAQGEGLVQVAGTLDAGADGAGESGGSVRVLGDRIALLGARIDASGDAGGGEILVGGDVHGGGGVATASRTYVGAGTQLVADAGSAGDGGKIVVWSEEATGFHGGASARGGSASGDGGFIEISGRHYLETGGHTIDLSAPNGGSGTLLYDPERILIRGGSGDGDDADPGGTPPDPQDVLDDGDPGRILEGDAPNTDFVIYESEIEGTDADIILQAEREIRVEGTAADFTNTANGEADGTVVVMPGNSLVVQTTGDPRDPDVPNDPGPLYAIDLGEDLTWQVSEGGIISISTAAGDTMDLANSARGSIRVGNLHFLGREFFVADDGRLTPLVAGDADLASFGVPQDGSDQAIRIVALVGDIVAGNIVANGEDARIAPDGTLQAAAPGGGVQIQTESGNIEVDSIESTGGSALAAAVPAPSDGGFGGPVFLTSNSGSVRVNDHIDVSGGDGLAGRVPLPDDAGDFSIDGDGGNGGTIVLTAQNQFEGTPKFPVVNVFGDLLATGGDGAGVIAEPQADGSAVPIAGIGGSGGAIVLSGEAGILVKGLDFQTDPDNPVPKEIHFDASGGDGVGGGGSGGLRGADFAIDLRIPSLGPDVGENILLEDVVLIANGGDALVGGPGGDGGDPGGVLVAAGNGAVLGAAADIEANGGDGQAGPSDAFFAPHPGGSTNSTIRLTGAEGVTIGSITSLGGTGADGGGGRGGDIDIDTGAGDIQVGAIDVSGGDAFAQVDGPLEALGGQGGVVQLTTGTFGLEPDVEPAGHVRLDGRIASFGGSGVDVQGQPVVSPGGQVAITADGAIEAAVGASIEAGSIDLEAPVIGTPGAPIALAGTFADQDQATLTTSGSIVAELLPEHGPAAPLGPDDPNDPFDFAPGSGLEDVTVLHLGPAAETRLTNDGLEMLTVVGDDPLTMVEEPPTIERMRSDDTDPALHFVLSAAPAPDVPDGGEDPLPVPLQIDEGAVALGVAGGSITNQLGALVGIGDPGNPGPDHIATTGNLVLDALGIGGDPEAELDGDAGTGLDDDPDTLRIAGDAGASLQLLTTGDVGIDVTSRFGGIDVTQRSETGQTALVGIDRVTVEDVSPDPATPLQELTGSIGDTNLAYRLVAPPVLGVAPSLQVRDLDLGGDGVFEVTGQLTLAPSAAPSSIALDAGNQLTLVAGDAIVGSDPDPAPGEDGADILWRGVSADPSGLVLVVLDGSATGASGALVTQNIGELAANVGGDLHLVNRREGEIVLSRIDVRDPTDPSGDAVERTHTGILSAGDVTLENQAGDIVLGHVPVVVTDFSDSFLPGHVKADGDVAFESDVEIENAQFVEVSFFNEDGVLESERVPVNWASVEAGGDVSFAGTIQTGTNLAVDGGRDPLPDASVDGALTVQAGGVVSFAGDVGGDPMDPAGALARLDTSAARLPLGADPVRSFHVAQAIFRGGLEGPAAATIVGAPASLPAGETATSVAFGGNVGGSTALEGLVVQADQIRFSVDGGSAERVVTGAGGIHLDTGTPATPATATITDTLGDLSIQTSGVFAVGAHDKLSAVGDLGISAAQAVVGDLSASSIVIASPDIQVTTRPAAAVELPDGSTVLDGGVDWVANSITTTSLPKLPANDPNPPLSFFLGSGGISVPGSLAGFPVRRLNADLDAVSLRDFFGVDGVVLDLTGSGPRLVGNPVRQLPRLHPIEPEAPLPRFGSDAPGEAPQVSAAQVLAFLRCAEVYPGASPAGDCRPEDRAALASVRRFADSALASARAREITARYRELVATPAAVERLRQVFSAAGSAFRGTREWDDASLDGADFYRFLASAPREQQPALASMRELAWLSAQIELLGLADADTRLLRETLAQEFADAAGLPGLSAQAVRAAVEASPVGLPE